MIKNVKLKCIGWIVMIAKILGRACSKSLMPDVLDILICTKAWNGRKGAQKDLLSKCL